MKRDLAGALALREPRRLDVGEVVEVEARDGEHPEVHVRALRMLDPLLEQGVARLEGPRHERGEAAERILELADRVEVVEQIVGLLYVAVHHRRRRLESPPMGLAMDREPGLWSALFPLESRSES